MANRHLHEVDNVSYIENQMKERMERIDIHNGCEIVQIFDVC